MKLRFPIWLAALPMVLAVACIPISLSSHVTEPRKKVVCVAHYTPVLPNTAVGADSCGNRWLMQDGRCWYYMRDQGVVVEIHCPAAGDTTYAE